MSNGNGRSPNPNVIDLEQVRRTLGNQGWVKYVAGLVLLIALAFTSFYQVQPEEVGIVLRFGKFIRTTDPGLHFKLPLGLERVLKVPVQRQLKQEFGFRTAQAGVRTRYDERGYEGESLMLTGDLNIAEVEWVVQYRVVDARKYLFRVRNVTDTFRAMSEAVMRDIVGDRTVNEVLTIGRQEIATIAEQELQALCEQYETGLRVEQVVLQDVNPPDPVKPSFNEVNEAQQEREAKINAAQSEYNKEVPKAKGEAQQRVQQAEGYAIDRVNRAQGDAQRFNALYSAYRKAPQVTRTRMYLETMNDILPRSGSKIVVDESSKGLLPMFNVQNDAKGAAGSQLSGGGAR